MLHCCSEIENTHLRMTVSVQPNSWATSAVGRGLTVRWNSDEASLCNLLVYSQFASDEPRKPGRRISADTAVCEASLQHQMWFHPEKNPAIFNLFLSLITKTVYSWVHDTRLAMVSWSALQGKGILRSKSNKSYEVIHCVTVLMKSWSWQSHLTLSHHLFELCGWHLFVLFWRCPRNHKRSYLSFSSSLSTLKNELKHGSLSCPLLRESAENSLGLFPICWG